MHRCHVFLVVVCTLGLSSARAFAQAETRESPASAPLPATSPAAAPSETSAASWLATSAVKIVAAEDGASFSVRVDSASELMCNTPCELALAPGRHRVQVGGDASFKQWVTVESGGGVLLVEKRHNGRIVQGVVSLAVGVPVAIAGAYLLAAGLIIGSVADSTASDKNPGSTLRTVGAVTLAGGAALALIGSLTGFPFVGHDRLVMQSSPASKSSTALQLIGLNAGPTPRGGATLGAVFSF